VTESFAKTESVSVVVPTLNRQALLCQLLANLAAQTRVPDEVIVVDQTPPTSQDLAVQRRAADGLRLVRCVCPRPAGTSGARNIGLSHAGGDFVLMLDDDHRLGPDVIEAYLKVMREGMDVVKGDIIEGGRRLHENPTQVPLGSLFEVLLRTRYAERQVPTIGVNSGFTMYRREWLELVGGFDGRFRGWYDDYDTGLRLWRAGARMCHDPRPVATHLAAEGGRRSYDEAEYMNRNAARWAFLICHFGQEWAREHYLITQARTALDVICRRAPISRIKSIPAMRRSWKRARSIAALPPQRLWDDLPDHLVVEQSSSARAVV
jgi:GT2 family glycosyltransferase